MTWEMVPLPSVAEIQGGLQKSGKRRATPDNAWPFLRVANVTAHGLDLREVHTIAASAAEAEKIQLRRGDLLVVEGNGSANQIGRAAVWQGSIENCLHQNHLIRVRPNQDQIDPRYLGIVWNSPQLREHLTRVASSSSGLHTLSVSKLKRLEVPLPDLPNQRRIVELIEEHLSHLDAADAALHLAEGRLHSLRRSLLALHFTPAPGVRLSELVLGISAGKSLGASAGPAPEGEWGIIKVSAMTWGAFRETENKHIPAHLANVKYEIHPGDLLVSRANTSDYVGAPVLVGDVRPRLLLSDKSMRVTPVDGVNPQWLVHALAAPPAREQISSLATGTSDSMRNISQKTLLSITVPDARRLDQQAAIDAMTAFDEVHGPTISAITAAAARSTALRRAVLTAAFSGRLTGSSSDAEVIEETAAALPSPVQETLL